MPIDSRIRVVRSSIHGYGVVARRDIATGEIIAEVEGILWGDDDDRDDTYSLWVEDGRYFDMVDQTRWINHSCAPNAEVEAELDGQGSAWARIIAQQPIKAGEEITYHYAFPAELAERCSCGSSDCAGWIVDPDDLPRLLARLASAPAAR